jgi:glycosyltransferase involved in cell wall biosynthesis
VRRVLECADDWRELLPHRRDRIEGLLRRAAREADGIVLVSDGLRELFPSATTVVVPNGVGADVLTPAPTPPPGDRRLVYVGTLSERFDAPGVAELLDGLGPDWRLDLHGQCQYQGCGEAPGQELEALLQRFHGRITLHGTVSREEVATAIDAADVAIVPNRLQLTIGQDSMKLYDYAARGRPIVGFGGPGETDARAGVRQSRDAAGRVAAVLAASSEPEAPRQARRAWALTQRWESRWEPWRAAVFGPSVSDSS